jgi:CIC family chloride channel protein
MWAGVIAYILNNRFHGFKPLFVTAAHTPEYTIYEYGGSVLVALTVAVPVTIGFAYLVSSADRLIGHVESQWLAVWTSFLSAVVALLWFWGFGISPSIILGMGEGFLEDILTGEDHSLSIKILSLALIGKMITTGLTMRGGGSAGLLIPSMFFGGVTGALTALIFTSMTGVSLDPSLFAVVGISTSLVAVIGVPLASIALVLEVFGPTFGPPTILASGATYLITLHIKIYKFQENSPSPEHDEIGTINDVDEKNSKPESVDSKECNSQQDMKEQPKKD